MLFFLNSESTRLNGGWGINPPVCKVYGTSIYVPVYNVDTGIQYAVNML